MGYVSCANDSCCPTCTRNVKWALQVAMDARTCSTTSTRQSSPALLSKRDTLCVPSNTWAGTDDASHHHQMHQQHPGVLPVLIAFSRAAELWQHYKALRTWPGRRKLQGDGPEKSCRATQAVTRLQLLIARYLLHRAVR